jgi:hypothetical protein
MMDSVAAILYDVAWVAVIGAVVVQLVRRRRVGPTPVGWVPRPLRPWVNRYYRSRGWDGPFDELGNRRPWPVDPISTGHDPLARLVRALMATFAAALIASALLR